VEHDRPLTRAYAASRARALLARPRRYVKYSRVQRAAIMPLVLWHRFPGRKWYVFGHDDTLWSPLALARFLRRFDPFDDW